MALFVTVLAENKEFTAEDAGKNVKPQKHETSLCFPRRLWFSIFQILLANPLLVVATPSGKPPLEETAS